MSLSTTNSKPMKCVRGLAVWWVNGKVSSFRESVQMRKLLISIILFFSIVTAPGWATSTGLNNIPTADVVPERVLVYQFFTDLKNDSKPDHFMGFKYGLLKNVEIGFDSRVSPEKAKEGNFVAQGKVRFELSSSLAIAAGITNLGDRAKAGRESPFGVLSKDFGFFRAHFGGTAQRDNEGFFCGIDKTFEFLNRDLTLRGDLIQTNDRHDTTASAGFVYDLCRNILLESWVSFPSESGRDNVATIKLNYVFRF